MNLSVTSVHNINMIDFCGALSVMTGFRVSYEVSMLVETNDSGLCRRPISYSDEFLKRSPTPDSETWRVWGLAMVDFSLLMLGLKPSRKFCRKKAN